MSDFKLIKCHSQLNLELKKYYKRISCIWPKVRLKMATQSVDGSGNFKITKFFEVKTGKCSNFIFLTLFSLCERPKSIPFLENVKKPYLFPEKRVPFFNVRHQTVMLWFWDLFLSISSLFKISKIGLWKLFCKWKSLCKVEKEVALTSDYICWQKMKKGTLFINWLL